MLVAMRCDCGGSENLIRRALERGRIKDWARFPIAVGKKQALELLSNGSFPQDDMEIRSLVRFLQNTSKFAVVLGIKNGVIRWANLSDGTSTAKLDADVIIERLA